MTEKWTDLGLTYDEACHAMQTGVAYEMTLPEQQSATEPKHLRTGVNVAMVDHAALAYLLIRKGIITEAEYRKELRLAMNHEVSRYQAMHPPIIFR